MKFFYTIQKITNTKWRWLIYHYAGEMQMNYAYSSYEFASILDAMNACHEYIEENNIEAKLD